MVDNSRKLWNSLVYKYELYLFQTLVRGAERAHRNVCVAAIEKLVSFSGS